MTHKEIARAREKLIEIQKEPDQKQRFEELQKFAKEIGASVTRIVTTITEGEAPIGPNATQVRKSISFAKGSATTIWSNEITETEIVQNINDVLQTETMIDMCKIATRNFWITIIAVTAAVFSALAAWVAIVKMVGWKENL